jgi:hypothetical protein
MEKLHNNLQEQNIKIYEEKIFFNDKLTTLQYSIYIEKNYKSSLEIFEKIFFEFISNSNTSQKAGNKHKCNRNPECLCKDLGLYLIDIVQTSLSHQDIMNVFEKYYHNPGINLPYKVFKMLCLSLLRSLDFQKVNSLIENYITYSNVESLKNKENRNISSQLQLKENEFDELNEILIFDIILIQGGFNKAKLKINTLKDDKLKQKYLSKLFNIFQQQKGLKCDDIENSKNLICDLETGYMGKLGGDPNLCKKLTDVVDKNINENRNIISIDTNYSGYTIKASIFYKILSILTNKKMLAIMLAVYLIWIIKKVLKYKKIDEKILNLISLFLQSFRRIPIISAVDSFVSGLFKLLINY